MNTDQFSAFLQPRLSIITEHLRPLAKLGVLYGSQLVHPSLDRDIDVLVVVSDTAHIDEIFSTVAHLQNLFLQVLHVIVISEQDLEINASLKELIEAGVYMWNI